MEDLLPGDEERFVATMMQRLGHRAREVMRAVNAARTGYLIDDNEGQVLAVLRELERELYQAAIQARVDATEAVASFSPSGRLGTADGGSGSSRSFGDDAAGACAMDASAVLESGGGSGGSRGSNGGSEGSDGEPRGA